MSEITLSETNITEFKLFMLAPSLSHEVELQVLNYCQTQDWLSIETATVKLDQRCSAVSLKIGAVDIIAAKAKFKALAQTLEIDLVLLPNSELTIERKLAVFDMDSTLIQVEVIDELAKRAGVGEQVITITAAAMRGELDFNQSFKQRLGLLKGLSDSVLADIAENLPMMEGMEKLIAGLQQRGYKTAILSGGFNYFAEFLQQKYGFDYSYSNTLEVESGKVTGKVVGEIVNGERKVQHLQNIAKTEGFDLSQTIAVGDGANDLPMLAAAGLGVAFHAKPLVRAQAQHSISHLGLDALLYLIDTDSSSGL